MQSMLNVKDLNGKLSFMSENFTAQHINFSAFYPILILCSLTNSSQRSKSVISDDIPSEVTRNYPLRRHTAIVDFKPKVSKWTKVKAAFKWEKANALPEHRTHSKSGSKKEILRPANIEVARYTSDMMDRSTNYLRIPSMPCTGASSGDSVISSSSRDMGLTQSPDYLSSGSSGDETDQPIKNKCKKNFFITK